MSRKRKANITPEDVGKFYLNPKTQLVNICEACGTEPMVTMHPIGAEPFTQSLSYFDNYVRLKPEREIPKPATPRKPRVDKGGSHKVKPSKIDLELISIAVAYDYQPAMAAYKDTVASNPTLRGAVLDLFGGLGIVGAEKVIEYVKAQPDSANKKILINALGG